MLGFVIFFMGWAWCVFGFWFRSGLFGFYEIPLFTSKATILLRQACKQLAMLQGEARKRGVQCAHMISGFVGHCFILCLVLHFKGKRDEQSVGWVSADIRCWLAWYSNWFCLISFSVYLSSCFFFNHLLLGTEFVLHCLWSVFTWPKRYNSFILLLLMQLTLSLR